MFCRNLSSALAALFVLVVASSAFATDPYICDPEQDPEQCECPLEGVDACYEVAASNLISPDDPLQLREAAGITSSWNNKDEVWDVKMDATGLTAAGVMKLNSNRGQWDSIAQLHKYLGALIGQDLQTDFCGFGSAGFPRMRIHQVGVTTRYDQFNEDWAAANSSSLVFDAITDTNGDLFIKGTRFPLFPVGNECNGRDPAAFGSAKDGSLAGAQCSAALRVQGSIAQGPCKESITYFIDKAQTTLETSKTTSFGKTIYCRGSYLDGNQICDVQNGMIVHERVRADELDIISNFYLAGSFDSYDGSHPDYNEVDTQDTATHVNGVCSRGDAKDGNGAYFIRLKTRDGSYDSNHDICQ